MCLDAITSHCFNCSCFKYHSLPANSHSSTATVGCNTYALVGGPVLVTTQVPGEKEHVLIVSTN